MGCPYIEKVEFPSHSRKSETDVEPTLQKVGGG